MDQLDWAKNEIKIACENLSEGTEDSYIKSCYMSALKSFESLYDGNPSGLSFRFTREILERLLYGLPLNPIEDTDDTWDDVTPYNNSNESNGVTRYQCSRLDSLFKYVYSDGNIKYFDVSRTYCYDVDNPDATFTTKIVDDIIDEMFPVKMPYYPLVGKYKVAVKEIFNLSTVEIDDNNSFDEVLGVFDVITPDAENIVINRYFKLVDSEWKEISKEEWLKYI